MIEPERPDLEIALEEFDISQQTLFNAATRLVRDGTSRDVWAMHVTPGIYAVAFNKAVAAILEDPELIDEARANLLANLYVGGEKERVKHFNKVLPLGQFCVASSSRDYAAEKLEADLVRGMDIEDLHAKLAMGFWSLLQIDINRFMYTLLYGG